MLKPKIMILVDARGWIFDIMADNIIHYLGHKYDFYKSYNEDVCNLDYDAWDLILIFPWNVYGRLPKPVKRSKLICGMYSYISWDGMDKKFVADVLNDYYSAIGCGCADLYNEFNGLVNKIFYTPCGVNTDIYHDYGKRDFVNDKLVFGWMGKEARKQKGYYDLVEPAIRELKDEIIFDPMLASKHLVVDKKPSLSQSQLCNYYNSIHVLICSAHERSEAGPHSVLECGATGGVLISTPIALVKEFGIPGFNYIKSDWTVESMIKCIRWVSDNRSDLNRLRSNLSSSIRRSWSIDFLSRNYEQMFDWTLGKQNAN